MLRTQEGQWVHGVCALYTPGVSLAAAEGAEDAASWLAVGVPALLMVSKGKGTKLEG